MPGDVVDSDIRDGEGPLAVAEPLVRQSSSLGGVAAAAAVSAGARALAKSHAVLVTERGEEGGVGSFGWRIRSGRASSFAVSIHQQAVRCEGQDLRH